MFGKKENTNYWQSYSDLLIALLVVFMLIAIVSWNQYRVKVREYEKIEEVKSAFRNISKDYFEYDKKYQKHILKVKVHFPVGSFKIKDQQLITQLNDVKERLVYTMDSISKQNPNIRYLLVIEGQASDDGYYTNAYRNNDVLSFQRALELRRLWFGRTNNLQEILPNCEVIVSGSGAGGFPREIAELKNQRFLIQIIPKIDKIKD